MSRCPSSRIGHRRSLCSVVGYVTGLPNGVVGLAWGAELNPGSGGQTSFISRVLRVSPGSSGEVERHALMVCPYGCSSFSVPSSEINLSLLEFLPETYKKSGRRVGSRKPRACLTPRTLARDPYWCWTRRGAWSRLVSSRYTSRLPTEVGLVLGLPGVGFNRYVKRSRRLASTSVVVFGSTGYDTVA